MKTFLILFSLLFLGQKSVAQDWILVGSDSDGDKWYIKSSYVSKDNYGGGIKLWVKKEVKKTTIKKKGQSFTYINAKELQLLVADCSERKLKFVASTLYNSQGKVVNNWTLEDFNQEWLDVVPDSIGEIMLEKICELMN
jgi:hypothetical protein